MFEIVFALSLAFLFGFAIGFTVHEQISRPVMEDYDRLLRREARDMLRGKP